jgi:hypothetical protein
MKTQQKPKKHHFVPECYLKNFLNKNMLYTLNLSNLKKGYSNCIKEANPSMICYLEDYYKIENEILINRFNLDNQDTLFVETTVLTSLEQEYPKLYQKIINSGELNYEEAVDFSEFIVQIKLRNPYYLENSISKNKIEWLNSSMEDIYTEITNDPKFFNINDELKELAFRIVKEDNLNEIGSDKKLQLSSLLRRHFKDVNEEDKIRDAIIKNQWILLCAPENGPYFITTDNPGFSITDFDDKIYNSRFKDGFLFHFPLSPKFCLLISDIEKGENQNDGEQKIIDHVNVDAIGVIKINDCSIQRTNKLLIASDDWYLIQIEKNNRIS